MREYNDHASRFFNSLTREQMSFQQGRFARATKLLRAYESMPFNEYDLRGLSKMEKEFIRDNGMKTYFDDVLYKRRFYLFINRDRTTGKRHLYAYDKKQWLNPAGKGYIGESWNCDYWLIVDTDRHCISPLLYEHRPCGSLAPIMLI